MRLHLLLTGSKIPAVPFNYQPALTGAIHKWIGRNNEIHDGISLYSFSWLTGGEVRNDNLVFPKGARLFFSAFDRDILKRVIKGVQSDPKIGYGLTVSNIVIEDYPEFKTRTIEFLCASPVLVKRTANGRAIHYTFDQRECDKLLTETLRNKLKKAGLSEEGVSVAFNRDFHGAKTKVIYYNQIGNKVNLCPIKITGTPEQLAFAWDVGAGNSTGIGFGALK